MNDLLRRDLLTLMDIDAAFAPGDLRDSSHLVTLAYHGGGVARSAAKQREFHSPAAPGASGTYFAGGLTINVSDLGKLVALKDPEVVKKLNADGSTPVGSSPEAYTATIRAEVDKWRKLAKAANLQLH